MNLRVLMIALTMALFLPDIAALAQSPTDTLAVEISVARALRPTLPAASLFESRESGSEAGKLLARERPTAGIIADSMGTRVTHLDDVLACDGVNCSLKPGVDRVVVLRVVRLGTDSAEVQVMQWIGPRLAYREWKSFKVARTANGWIAKQTPIVAVE